jgi:hypothetical protein
VQRLIAARARRVGAGVAVGGVLDRGATLGAVLVAVEHPRQAARTGLEQQLGAAEVAVLVMVGATPAPHRGQARRPAWALGAASSVTVPQRQRKRWPVAYPVTS